MSKPLVCVTVSAPTTAELCRQRDEVTNADLIELRIDSVVDPDVRAALAGRRGPVVVTCRPSWEGGGFRGSEEERHRLLADAISLGAEYVDLEWKARWDDLLARRGGRGIVLSMHDFEGVPADLAARFQAMRATGAEVVKIAVRSRCLADCVTLFELGVQSGGQASLVVLGMGDYGLPTRVLAGRFGSRWTYAGSLRDVGQLTAQALIKDYCVRTIGESTAIYGITGGSVGHSVSPAMHNAAFRAAGLDAVYLPLPSVSAADFMAFGKAIGLAGASITIPHKVTLIEHLDEVDPVARRIGAVNTIRVQDGRWVGGNTDAIGFLEPLHGPLALKGLRASVLGAGGAARAVAIALASSACSVRVHARSRAQAEEVAMATGAAAGPWPPERGSWDLLINCTPIGQYPRVNDTPIDAGELTGRFVYDLVYNPTRTRLLREAGEKGCATIGGLEMLVAQAREQFGWWTGAKAPAGVMREAALKRLAEFATDENHVV